MALKLVWFILNNSTAITEQVEQLITFIQDMIDRWKLQDGDVPPMVGNAELDEKYPLLAVAAVDCVGVEGVGDRLGLLKLLAEFIKNNPEIAELLLALLKSLIKI